MRGLWKPGAFERGGNTKTHGIVRGEFIVHDNLPPELRHGIFAKPQTYRAWVRFSGPGPYITPDIDDVGFMSISIKLMGVPGPKLMEEEKFTQDMFGVSHADLRDARHRSQRAAADREPEERADLLLPQPPSLARARLHHAGAVDQDAEQPVRSAVLQLRAVSARAKARRCSTPSGRRSTRRTPIPRLPLRPPDDYLRDAMVAALDDGDVEFDFRIQLQTDPYLMPIENNGGAVAREALAARHGRHAAHPAPEIRFAGADGVREAALVQPLALHPGASPARQPEPRPPPDVRDAVEAAAPMNNVPHYEPTGDEVFE